MLRCRARVSGPLLDCIDLQIQVPRLPLTELGAAGAAGDSSPEVRECVIPARKRQQRRADKPNAVLSNRETRRDCELTAGDRGLLERALHHLNLSARAYHRILRVARTIADLADSERIGTVPLTEAIQYQRALGQR